MRRRKPEKQWCTDCSRLAEGKFTVACENCKHRYTSDRRTTELHEWKGYILTAAEWARELGYSESAVYHHLRNGKGIAEIIEQSGRSVQVEARLKRTYGTD